MENNITFVRHVSRKQHAIGCWCGGVEGTRRVAGAGNLGESYAYGGGRRRGWTQYIGNTLGKRNI